MSEPLKADPLVYVSNKQWRLDIELGSVNPLSRLKILYRFQWVIKKARRKKQWKKLDKYVETTDYI